MELKYLFQGRLLHESSIRLAELKAEGKEDSDEARKVGCLGAMVAVPLVIGKLILLFYTFDIDPLKWPTIIEFFNDWHQLILKQKKEPSHRLKNFLTVFVF